ncbi:CDP-alcohol phosphatidyltransferase family protein [Alphaproteobacteria bacterium]|nr:CDP-alcohol phosphatidyltransferase family protein [Alphaproteobacteria bacterium]
MFDRSIQRLTQKPLSFVGKFLLKIFKPNQITIIGFLFGIVMCFLIFIHSYFLAILFLFLNRLCDGLDGVMARQTSPSPLGAYLDIILDFIIYAAFVLVFSLQNEINLLTGVFLLFSYICTGTTFLTQAIIQPQLDYSQQDHDDVKDEIPKSFIYASGLIEGSETIFFMFICLILPKAFPILGFLFGILCLITAIARVIIFYKKYKVK